MSLKNYVEKTIEEVEAFRNTTEGRQYPSGWFDYYIMGLQELTLLENDLERFCELHSTLTRIRCDSGPMQSFGPNDQMLGNAMVKLHERHARTKNN